MWNFRDIIDGGDHSRASASDAELLTSTVYVMPVDAH